MLERKCVAKNDGKNHKKCEILAYLKNHPKRKFTSKITDFREKRKFSKQILPARAEARSGIGLSCKVFLIKDEGLIFFLHSFAFCAMKDL